MRLVTVAVVGLSLQACERRTPPIAAAVEAECSAHLAAYDWREREIALQRADDIGDDSAIRAATRLQSQQAQLQAQAMDVQLMVAKHCQQLPKEGPKLGDEYYVQALECKTATILKASDVGHKCNANNWVRPKPAASSTSAKAASAT